MLSLIFKGFPENQKNWRFRWPRTCEKIAIFFAGPRSSKSSIFWFSGKPLKIKESIPTWHQDNWNVKIHSFGGKICRTLKLAKIAIFSQVRGHRNLQFFWFSGKPLKIKESIPYLTSGQLKCKNSLIWGQNMQNTEISKNCNFFAGPRSSKSSIFLIFWKAFENQGKHPYLTSGQLKCKNSLIWGQNMQNTELAKIAIFSQVRGHRNLQFFDFLESLWKSRKASLLDIRTTEM